jgi:preprotein translocase subunit SecG
MEHVVLVIHLILALAIIGLVLIQRSEGGGLGIGGSGGGLGGLATAGQTANALTRATGICAGLFFVTSLTLGVMAGLHHKSGSLLENLDNVPASAVSVDTPEKTTDKELPEADQSGATKAPVPSAPISE